MRIDFSTFTFSSRTALAVICAGGSIAVSDEQLQQMVLEHVAHDAGFLVVLAAIFDADRLRRRDLHVVDPLPVPDRLEDRVGKAQNQHVLHRLLAEIMIDAIRLMLGEQPEHEIVERQRALEAAAERLLDDDARPRPILGRARPRRESARRKIPHDRLEHARRHGEIENPIAFSGSAPLLELGEPLANRLVVRSVGEVGRNEVETLADLLPDGVIELPDFVRLRERLAHLLAERVVGLRRVAADAEHLELLVDEVLVEQLVDRRQQLATTQIAQRAEDHHRARIRVATLLPARLLVRLNLRRRMRGDDRRGVRRGRVVVMRAPPRGRRTRCAAPR